MLVEESIGGLAEFLAKLFLMEKHWPIGSDFHNKSAKIEFVGKYKT